MTISPHKSKMPRLFIVRRSDAVTERFSRIMVGGIMKKQSVTAIILPSIILQTPNARTAKRHGVVRRRDACAISIVLCLLIGCSAFAENWPDWRGPNRCGVSAEKNIAVHWSPEKNIAWKTALPGSGISSPIVWHDRIFLTASDGAKQSDLHILCLNRDNGKLRWHLKLWGTAPTRHHANKSSMASPTPVTDGRHVFAFFGTGDVFCADVDGGLVWHRSLASEYGRFENRFAATSSPLLYRDLVLVQCDHYGDSYVAALEKKTGADRWKVDRPEAWLSWSSPQLASVGDSDQHELIVCGSQKIDAFNPLTGGKLWTVGGMRRECIPTPVLGHGLIYAVSGPKGPTLAIRPGGRGDVSESHVKWSATRSSPFVPSAILVGDLYYLVDDQGIGTCLDAHTGKRLWQKRFSGAYTASPVATNEHIYFTNESGETTVFKAHDRLYEEAARNSLGEPVFSSPAISHGRLFIRTTKQLFCIAPTRIEK